nr:putative ribonuclease H-like domain-containing protein [Tanacetum cinerariifolium]
PQEEAASESSVKKKGRTVVITTEDMQKRRNDVKARTTLLLALPDKHQLRFSKYEIAKELWEAILKTFGGNKATKKTNGIYNPEFPDRVYKVEKAMYGLHQAPRAWYGTLSKYLLANGFQRGSRSNYWEQQVVSELVEKL